MKQQNTSKQSAFTIVELLVVIVVIGILAAITIVSFTGVSQKAIVSSLKSDLSGASKRQELYKVDNGQYPSNLAETSEGSGTYCPNPVDTKYCIKLSSGNSVVSYSGNAITYELIIKHDNIEYRITNGTMPELVAGSSGNTGIVTTLAGSGSYSFADGTGTAASFNGPRGVAVDSSGNVYVADTSNSRIRKITSAGVVTTLAGSGTAAYADGTGTTASFNGPQGVAVDSSGNVYVADINNNRIRKITSAGIVTTLAGSGSYSFADGTGTAASIAQPAGVAVDSSGNVYVADSGNNRIRKITSAGVVTTLAGSGIGAYTDGTGTTASFNGPQGVAVDSSGNVYVADSNNSRIRKITSAGVVTTLAGSGDWAYADGTGTTASFNGPQGVAVDSSGNVYVADTSNSRIRKITSAGVVTTLAGSAAGFADGTGTAASFNYPYGVDVDSSGNVYVADINNSRIRKIQ